MAAAMSFTEVSCPVPILRAMCCPDRQVGDGRQQVRFHHVGHVGIGAGLLPVAVHGEGVAFPPHPQETGNYQRVLTVRWLARAVNVEVPQRHDAHAEQPGE